MAKGFREQVYALCRQVPFGKVTTYGEIARVLDTKAYRAVGQALKCNADPITIPCFKVVKSDGSLGGYNGPSLENVAQKIEKLRGEGIEVVDGRIKLEKYCFSFPAKKSI